LEIKSGEQALNHSNNINQSEEDIRGSDAKMKGGISA
jgi:hypothetical protein